MTKYNCNVVGCNEHCKKEKCEKRSLFTIKKTSKVFKQLTKYCHQISNDEIKICERHYTEKKFKIIRNKKNEIIGKRLIKKHRNEMPTLNLNSVMPVNDISVS